MSARSRRVSRLRTIRELTEAADQAVLEVALASVAAVESGLARQKNAIAQSRNASRDALSEGNRLDWLLAEASREAAGWNHSRLQPLLQSSAAVAEEAMRTFLNSRREHEQAKLLSEAVHRAECTDQERRAQHAADEWFLGRWTSRAE